MRCFFHTILACLIWALLPAYGDALPESLARPPESGVLDGGGLFNRDAAALERIRGLISQLEREHGYRIHLVVEPVFISTTAPELAARLQEEWLPDGNGLVIVFESDSRNLGFGRDVVGKADSDVSEALVPTHETAALLRHAMASTDGGLEPVVYLEQLVENLVLGFDGYFQRRFTPAPPGRSLRFTLLTIGGLALLALGAIVVGALARTQSVSGSRAFRFPAVDQPERLGAPCGGKVVSRSYSLKE